VDSVKTFGAGIHSSLKPIEESIFPPHLPFERGTGVGETKLKKIRTLALRCRLKEWNAGERQTNEAARLSSAFVQYHLAADGKRFDNHL
jgi:hypothetical protein